MVANKLEDFSDEGERLWHRRLAVDVFGLQLPSIIKEGAHFNLLGVSSETVTFSQRLDSRTYFILDKRHGHSRAAGVFRGPDEEQFAVYRGIFIRLGIPLEEIAEERVLHERQQAAQIDPKTKKVLHLEPVSEAGNFVYVTRRTAGLPVWSSHVKMGLNHDKQIGWLELHWPVIPEVIEREARRLQHMVANRWTPPASPGPEAESLEAGILHTPAVGLTFDIQAAIRVIYRPSERGMGKKLVLHLNRHGNPVTLRRTADLFHEPPQQRERPTDASRP